MKNENYKISEELSKLKEELTEKRLERIKNRLEKLEIECGDIKLRVELLTLGLIFAWLVIFVITILIL